MVQDSSYSLSEKSKQPHSGKKLGDAGDARAEVLDQFQIFKDAHQLFVPGNGTPRWGLLM
jgi:hypothetical protein